MTWAERLDVLDAWSQLLEGVYVHLPLKRSLYGFDPVRALAQLREQVPSLSDLQFHRELTLLINRLRDAHTQYQASWTVTDPVASLPFLVETYGPPEARRYVVSKVDRSCKVRSFKKGVEILHWNGIPFDRAIELHAESETGGRPDARLARALVSLTFRSLEYGPPPNEEWVLLGYRDLSGKLREARMPWEGIDPGRSPTASQARGARTRRAINVAAEAVRRAKKQRFSPSLWRKEGKARRTDRFADFVSARKVSTRHGKFGCLRIWSFDVDDDQAFVEAVVTLLRRLPDRGLIIDLRDNPGGNIWAAERLLQLFAPNPIVPARFALRATPTTAAMSQAAFNMQELAPWSDSLNVAMMTGEPYSSHLPITSTEQCNDVGQHYGGPVVIVVDANTYSSGDLFTAGIVDNRIGPVVCIGKATGAGGANVWGLDDLRVALAAAERPLPELPTGVDFSVAVRRMVRSVDAEGVLIEDAGVVGQPYAMTRDDIFRMNRDMIEHCAEILASQPWTRLQVRRRGRALMIDSVGIDRIDLYADGHPAGPSVAIAGDGRTRMRMPARAREIEIVGFSGGVVLQRRRLRR